MYMCTHQRTCKYTTIPLHSLSIVAGVDSVFSKIGCDNTAIAELLGGHAGVTDNTVLQYLGIVEQRTNELLQLQAFLQAKVYSLCVLQYADFFAFIINIIIITMNDASMYFIVL